MLWCLEYGREERTQRLLKLCNNTINARDAVDGYSLLYGTVVYGNPNLLLTMGANVHSVGFKPKHSPQHNTPISLAMYRANTFVTLQKALKTTAANFEAFVDQALETCPLQNSQWTKKTLFEPFSEDLDLLPILYRQHNVCPYCLYERSFMV